MWNLAFITPSRELNPCVAIMRIAPPYTSTPPVPTWARRMLLPRFGSSRIEELTPITHGLADDLIDDFVDAGHADAAQDYAQHIPVRVIARMLGVPLEDENIFTGWAVTILQQGFHDIQGSAEIGRAHV